MFILIFVLNLLYFGVLFFSFFLVIVLLISVAAYFSFRENVVDDFFEPNYDYLDSDSNFERKLILTELRAVSKNESLALNSTKDPLSNFDNYQNYLLKLTTLNQLDNFYTNNEIDLKFLNLFEFFKLNKNLILIKDFTFLIFFIIFYFFFFIRFLMFACLSCLFIYLSFSVLIQNFCTKILKRLILILFCLMDF